MSIVDQDSLVSESPNPQDQYLALLDSTDNYVRGQRFGDASRCIRQALTIFPASPLNSKLFFNLGLCLENENKLPEALQAFEISTIREPDNIRYLEEYAALAYKLPDTNLSDSISSKILSIQPSNKTALLLKGHIALERADIESAASFFISLIDNHPDYPKGYEGQGETEFARQEFQKAIQNFNKALEINPCKENYYSLISSLLMANLTASASDYLLEAFKQYPRDGTLHFLRAELQLQLHQTQAAEIDMKLAREYGVDNQIIEKFLKKH